MVYILVALWVVFGAGQWFTNMAEYGSDQAAHGLPFEWAEFLVYFGARFFENHASESWQLGVALIIDMNRQRAFRKGDEDRARLEGKVDQVLARLPDDGR